MLIEPLTKSERDRILGDLRRVESRQADARAKDDTDQLVQLAAEMERLRKHYFLRLPVVAMSTCPFCAKPLLRSFDPFGLDGPWWHPGAKRHAPMACRHFCLLRGAVNFHDKRPTAGPIEVNTGPEVPYVLPRILKMDSMTAVIGTLDMDGGYTVYPIAYFAPQRIAPARLAADWPDATHVYTRFGQPQLGRNVDPWDFNIVPWLKEEKLRWTTPGNRALAKGKSDQCPHLNVSGRRAQLSVWEQNVFEKPTP
jgi:hypothetical protein